MNLSHRMRRLAVTLMLAVVAAAYVAPAVAEAGNAYGHYRRWKPGPNGYRYSTRPVVRSYPRYSVRHSSGAAPFIAGLIGGAILGTALSQSHAHATVVASYYDPYCGITFGSLDACRAHFRGCGHPEVIRVVEGGRYTRDLCWQNGGWRDYHGDFSYRDRDGRADGRWNDRRDDGRWNDDRRSRDDRSWNDRRDSRDDDRRWNDRRGDDDQRFRDRGDDDDDRQYRDRDDDEDGDD